MSARILGLGTATPRHSVAQDLTAQMLGPLGAAPGTREAKLLPEVFRRTSVRHRSTVLIADDETTPIDARSLGWFFPPPNGDAASHLGPTTGQRMAEFQRLAPPLAIAACRNALREAGVDAKQITHLVTVTCTGFVAPGLDVELFGQLGLNPGVQRVFVGYMGCHAAVNGIAVSRSIAEADPNARVLLCCIELCTLHFQYGCDPQSVVANALFADGSAAMVIGDTDRGGSATYEKPWRIASMSSRWIPGTADQMSWRVEDHGFVMTLSPRVPMLIGEALRPWVDEWLASQGLSVEQVGTWAIHAGGPRIVTAVAERLGLGEERIAHSRGVLRDHGNMSSATVLFVLQRMREAKEKLPCVMLAFGPGLFAEAALLTE